MAKRSTKRELGLWLLTALVAGNMIGSGVFLLPSALASIGSIGIVGWTITAIGAILLALVFAQLSMMIPKVGGPYAFCHEGFGDFVGFQIAYNYWIAVWVGNAAIVVALISYLTEFLPVLKNNHLLAYGCCLVLVWFLTFINIISIKQAGIWQLVTTIIKLLPLLVIAFIGIFFIHPHYLLDNFNVSGRSNSSALLAAATLTLWSFVGLESGTVPAEAVKNPTRTIPRATIIGTLIAAVIYIVSTISVMGIIPIHTLADSQAPYADAAQMIFGKWGAMAVSIGAIISCFGALNGWILVQGQVPFAAACDGLFPKSFAKQTKSGTPIIGLIVSSCCISVLLLLTLHEVLVKQFTLIILLATLANLIPYFFTAMAELIILFRRREDFSPKRFWISVTIAILAGIYSFWAIVGSGTEILYYGGLLFFSGVFMYICMRLRVVKSKVFKNSVCIVD